MKSFTCQSCGYSDLFSKADNGNHEPPTCNMCESSNIVIISSTPTKILTEEPIEGDYLDENLYYE